jgi:YD repeat-containing protein
VREKIAEAFEHARYGERTVKYTMIGLALVMASPALAQDAVRKFYNDKGQIVGSSVTHGDRTKYYNANGQVTGSSTTARDGYPTYYNANGQVTGS